MWPQYTDGNDTVITSLTSDPQIGQGRKKYSYGCILCSLQRSALASVDYNLSFLLSRQWKITALKKLNIFLTIISINETDTSSTTPATVQMLNHLILMTTLEGRYYNHSHFIDEKSDERE